MLRKFDRRAGDNLESEPSSNGMFGFIHRSRFPSGPFKVFPINCRSDSPRANETTWMQGFTVGRHNGSMMVA